MSPKNKRNPFNRREAYLNLLGYLKHLRTINKFSQADVGKQLNISRSQYTSLETGRSMLTLDHLYDLEKVYGRGFIVRYGPFTA